MHVRRTVAPALIPALVLGLTLAAQALWSDEQVDHDAIYRLKDEGLQRSQILDIQSYLTDVYGPRLTGSPNLRAAAQWAEKKLTEWGVSNVRLEPWGPFGRGWSNERFVAHAITPQAYPLIGYPKAWTPGTNGPTTAEAVMAVIERDQDFETYRGTLKGKFVLTMSMREVIAHFEPPGHRWTDTELAELQKQPDPSRRRPQPTAQARERRAIEGRKLEFFVKEGVAGLLEPGRGDGGTIFVLSGGSRNATDPAVPLQVVLAVEHYGRIARTLEKKIPVTLELDVRSRFHDADLNSFTLVGEIPGTDKADELVMLGAHLDSWHAATGATDNAAGSAVVLETMRLLAATGLKPRRTVRVALWTGEEQGLLGSRAYVADHFADRETMTLKPEHAKLSVYFNVDNGTGAIRGVYLQSNEAVAPVFSRWMEPFGNLGMTTVTIRSTGGTDHLSFDAVGLPGFQFVQDPIEYETRTHHSNMDFYERTQAADMMQNAVIVASFVYHAATRETKLPRKPLPKPSQRTPASAQMLGGR